MDQQPTANEPNPTASPKDASASVSDQSFLAAFALAAFAGWTGLRSIYIKRPAVGVIRLGLLAVLFIAIIINMSSPYRSSLSDNTLNLIVVIALALAVWSIIDLVIAFVRRTDAEKKPLQEAPGERRMAVLMGVTSIAVPIILLGSLLIVFFATEQQQRPSDRPASSTVLTVSVDEAFKVYADVTADSTKEDIENDLQVSTPCGSDNCSYIVPVEDTATSSAQFLAKLELRYSGNTVRSISFVDSFANETFSEEDAS